MKEVGKGEGGKNPGFHPGHDKKGRGVGIDGIYEELPCS